MLLRRPVGKVLVIMLTKPGEQGEAAMPYQAREMMSCMSDLKRLQARIKLVDSALLPIG